MMWWQHATFSDGNYWLQIEKYFYVSIHNEWHTVSLLRLPWPLPCAILLSILGKLLCVLSGSVASGTHWLPPAWYWQDTNGISLKLPTVPGKDQPSPCNITLHLEIQCPVIHTTQWQHQPRPTNAALTHCERTLTPNQPITHWTTRSILSGV